MARPPGWLLQLNVVIGILLAYVSNAWIDSMQLGATEWRWQLGISAVPASFSWRPCSRFRAVPGGWLCRASSMSALAVLRLTGVEKPEDELNEIVASIHQERAAGCRSFVLAPVPLPDLLSITMGMFCQLSGINAVLYYLNDIFALAGATKVSGALQAVAVGATDLVATLAAMSVIDQFGRRKLLLIGTVGLAICLTAVSYVFMTHEHLHWLVWLLMAYIACFAISSGSSRSGYISAKSFPIACARKARRWAVRRIG